MAALAGFAAMTPIASGAGSATRIVDRTVLCKPAGIGYPESIRVLGVVAQPFQASLGGAPHAPTAYVYTPQGGEGLSVGLRTGAGGSARPTGEVWLDQTRCAQTKIRIPLTGSGLTGGTTEAFGDSYRCEVPAKVLIRVRADFKRPTSFSRDPRSPSLIAAKGNIKTGYLAVRTLRGRRPLFFASVSDATGKARAFAAPSLCLPT